MKEVLAMGAVGVLALLAALAVAGGIVFMLGTLAAWVLGSFGIHAPRLVCAAALFIVAFVLRGAIK